MRYCLMVAEQTIGKISEAELLKFIWNVSAESAYLHKNDMLHHDIK